MSLAVDTPTFNSLNKAQKRALILRDQLRFLEPHHLDTFIEGIADDEPPTYIKINGVIQPSLTFVTIKDSATIFDLGNVLLPEQGNAVHRVYLVVENGQIQMRAEEQLPLDDDVLDSVPIHGFIAKTTVALFKEKFQAIYARMNKINGARRAAYAMPNQPPALIPEGETLAQLDDPVPSENQNQSSSQPTNQNTRFSNDSVRQHISNSRQLTGLDTIPEAAKSRTFDIIPMHIKVDLFNSVVNTAFPNFDNLMMASWNVVSIYSACGSDFPELHKAIVELKGVLQDFDEAFGRDVERVEPRFRHDFGGAPGDGKSKEGGRKDGERLMLPAPGLPPENGAGQANGEDVSGGEFQRQDDVNAGEEHADFYVRQGVVEQEMPPLPALQVSEVPAEDIVHPEEREEEEEEEDQRPQPLPTSRQSSIHQPNPQYMAETRNSGSPPSSAPSSPIPQPRKKSRSSPANPTQLTTTAHSPTPELTRRRTAYLSSLGQPSSALSSLQNSLPAKAPTSTDPQLYSPSTGTGTSPAPSTSTPNGSSKKRKLSDYTVDQLRTKHQDRKTHLVRTFGGMDKVPPGQMGQIEQLEKAIRVRERSEQRGQREQQETRNREREDDSEAEERSRKHMQSPTMFGKYLGNSVLGARKQSTGVAPVAPMFPPSGGGRRGY